MNEEWNIWLERFRAHEELKGLAARTTKERVRLLGKFFAWCKGLGITSPGQLTFDLLVDYRRYRTRYVNNRGRRDTAFAINNHVISLRRFFEFLSDRGVVPHQILNSLTILKTPKLLPKYTLCHDEVMKVLSRIPADSPIHVRDRAMLEVLYSSGIRREELANLMFDDLDLDGGLVKIRAGKGGKDRMAPIGQHAVEWLRRYLASARSALLGRLAEHGRVFLSKYGLPIRPNTVTLTVKKWGVSTGLEKTIGPHTLRRSCATGLIRNGANPAHVKDILGHEDFSSLSTYVRLEITDLKEALRKYHPRERFPFSAKADL